ncbi:ribosomal large subunit pseudouridine synthase B [Candidatus Photodesmus blepharus]|uniref:Pseudouridine synthase n=1 Tax=Candidatus Photodesmus blepharonis TaxID=1179155 RepID=A0A084CPA8_9GAMM|nr:ribosomal large subunit pseudouridine synthase B [Candidatus Photodesmus blepharus]
MREKLQKVLARSGYGSRRRLESLIRGGRVSINGIVATLGDYLEDKNATIRIDSRVVMVNALDKVICRMLAYYKKNGELCTRYDPQGRCTVFDHLPKIHRCRWISVGRLDINTSGLLLFTTDGELANRLMHPSFELEREYLVRVFGKLNEKKIQNLISGVELEDGIARFENVFYIGGQSMNHTFYVVIKEGRNRAVRRLWSSQNLIVSRLKRTRYGDIVLNRRLRPGVSIELKLKEINHLRSAVQLSF